MKTRLAFSISVTQTEPGYRVTPLHVLTVHGDTSLEPIQIATRWVIHEIMAIVRRSE